MLNNDAGQQGTGTEKTDVPNAENPVQSTIINNNPTPPKQSKLKRIVPSWLRPEIILIPPLKRKLGRRARLVSVIIWVLLLIGASVGVYMIMSKDKTQDPSVKYNAVVTEQFKIIITSPSNGANNVPANSSISVQFNQPVDPKELEANFIIDPEIEGTFTQGQTDKEVIFKPKISFTEGFVVSGMVHGELKSKDGSELGGDHKIEFTTAIPGDGVIFGRKDYLSYEKVTSSVSNQAVTYSLEVGPNVNKDGEINLYQTDMNKLMDSFVYKDTTTDGYTYEKLVNNPIDTSAMKLIKTQKGLTTGTSFEANQSPGVYLALAMSDGKQAGYVWLVYSDFGLIVKQDDQKVVVSAQNLSTNATENGDTKLFNLKDSVSLVKESAFNDIASIEISNEPSVDVVIANINGQDVFAPLNMLESFADIRMTKDLSTAHKTYATTDKTAYRVGETVEIAGFDRLDNDMQYAYEKGDSVKLHAVIESGVHITDIPMDIKAGGMFSGSFALSNAYLPDGAESQQVTLYTGQNDHHAAEEPVATFVVTNQKDSAQDIKVSFAKSDYFSNESIEATITAKDDKGAPIKSQSINYNVYHTLYDENTKSNNNNPVIGEKKKEEARSVQLDANGQAKIIISADDYNHDQSNFVKVESYFSDPAGVKIAASAITVVHQADGKIKFGPSKTSIKLGDDVVARVYATSLNNVALGNKSYEYKLTYLIYNKTDGNTEKLTLKSGNGTFDGDGFGEITVSTKDIVLDDGTDFYNLTLEVIGTDNSGAKFTFMNNYYAQKSQVPATYGTLQLSQMDIKGSSGEVKVGDTVKLSIESPADLRVLVALERGRIIKHEMVSFKKGTNEYSFTVTDNLQSSFTFTLSYFNGGKFMYEGFDFRVDTNKKAQLSLAPSKPVYKAGEEMSLIITNKNSLGQNASTRAIVKIVDAKTYRFDPRITNIFDTYYAPAWLGTNSSSSLTSVGSGGGGRCGGHGGDVLDGLMNPVGTQLFWDPSMTIGEPGVNLKLKLPLGEWKIIVVSMDENNVSAVATTNVIAN